MLVLRPVPEELAPGDVLGYRFGALWLHMVLCGRRVCGGPPTRCFHYTSDDWGWKTKAIRSEPILKIRTKAPRLGLVLRPLDDQHGNAMVRVAEEIRRDPNNQFNEKYNPLTWNCQHFVQHCFWEGAHRAGVTHQLERWPNCIRYNSMQATQPQAEAALVTVGLVLLGVRVALAPNTGGVSLLV